MTKSILYKSIEKLCTDADTTIAELARKMGMSPQSLYNRLQTGKMTYEEISRMASILGFDFAYTFTPVQQQAQAYTIEKLTL